MSGILTLKKSNRGEPEGSDTVKIIYELSRQLNIRMPLTEACHNALFNKKDPEKEMSRTTSHRLVEC